MSEGQPRNSFEPIERARQVKAFAIRHENKIEAAVFSVATALSVESNTPSLTVITSALTVGLVVADRLASRRRKKAKRSAENVLGSKKTEKFTIYTDDQHDSAAEPVTIAEELKEYIGITIPSEQKRIEVSGRNRLHALGTDTYKLIPQFGRSYFDPEYNAVFVKKGSSEEDIIAATMLGYIDTTNLAFIEMEQEYQRRLLGVSEGKFESDFDVTKYAVYQQFREGLSLYAVSAVRDGRLESSEDDGALLDVPLAPEEEVSEIEKDERERRIDEHFGHLEEHIDSLREVFYSRGRARSRIKRGLFSQVKFKKEENSFVPGGFFSQKAIEELTQSYGIHPEDAINMLINNPPESVADLRNPESYVERFFNQS